MHPALVTAVVAERRRDQIAQATATRRARQARRVRRAVGHISHRSPRPHLRPA